VREQASAFSSLVEVKFKMAYNDTQIDQYPSGSIRVPAQPATSLIATLRSRPEEGGYGGSTVDGVYSIMPGDLLFSHNHKMTSFANGSRLVLSSLNGMFGPIFSTTGGARRWTEAEKLAIAQGLISFQGVAMTGLPQNEMSKDNSGVTSAIAGVFNAEVAENTKVGDYMRICLPSINSLGNGGRERPSQLRLLLKPTRRQDTAQSACNLITAYTRDPSKLYDVLAVSDQGVPELDAMAQIHRAQLSYVVHAVSYLIRAGYLKATDDFIENKIKDANDKGLNTTERDEREENAHKYGSKLAEELSVIPRSDGKISALRGNLLNVLNSDGSNPVFRFGYAQNTAKSAKDRFISATSAVRSTVNMSTPNGKLLYEQFNATPNFVAGAFALFMREQESIVGRALTNTPAGNKCTIYFAPK
jgi:hypothetical protein